MENLSENPDILAMKKARNGLRSLLKVMDDLKDSPKSLQSWLNTHRDEIETTHDELNVLLEFKP